MRDMPPIASIEILSPEVREQLAAQLRHFESLDAKAGVLLGFSGLLVALAPERATSWIDLARLWGVASAVCSLLAFFPRDYPVVRGPALRDYLAVEPVFTRVALLDTNLVMLEEARILGNRKARWLKGSIVSLLLAIISAFTGLAVESKEGGDVERQAIRAAASRAS